ncbi:Variant SH3 domain containing protein [Blastocystis sp. ATCC 50177/Nand II]|uniref:Variant SH3 domain containing protein n=1 Tax=Blastocystis sp. subtype 1 (strain ATCC 50177 / NandII) TaxID=478820 RepID=A0A196S919_BLAHN|nr:Variant SH3 domain containing protein [Blastocystis sp. ATCC 50177/Nand II]
MNKLKQKFESAMKSTAMSAQQIYKHKSFNLSKTQEDPEWDEPCREFMKIHQEVLDLIEQVKKFQSIVNDLCGNMVKIGGIFSENVNESDPESTKRIASAYDQIMKSCSEESLETATTRINDEILALLNQKLEEMKPLLEAIETRKKAKMDYDHYYFKLEQLRGKSNSDPNKNQNKFQECQTTLTAITDRLIDKFIEYETARPTFLAYEFQTLRSVQKDFFAALAQSMAKFKSTRPQEGMPTEPLVAPFSMSADFVSSMGASTAAPRKGPRARREEESDEEASSGSFRRPTPGAAAENAFSRGSGARKNPFANRASNAPAPVDIDEPAPAPRKPKGVYAVVLYDFPGEDEDELPLREGQKVRVTRQHESGWWTGELNGEIGMFPANYVKLL